jgi:GTP cyclohydrolase II
MTAPVNRHHDLLTAGSGGDTMDGIDQAGENRCSRWFDQMPERAARFFKQSERPLVIVSYAQSLDGSIATYDRKPIPLSSHHSMVLTHRLRAVSDAILIGINTLIIDDPLLTVRLVEGNNPCPIILDSRLRIPAQSRVLRRRGHRCMVAGTIGPSHERVAELEELGGEVIHCRPDPCGKVDLVHLLHQLGRRGIRSVMVEGGGEVITSFLQSRLADHLVLTIAPRFVGGLPALGRLAAAPLSFTDGFYHCCGPDIVFFATPRWHE